MLETLRYIERGKENRKDLENIDSVSLGLLNVRYTYYNMHLQIKSIFIVAHFMLQQNLHHLQPCFIQPPKPVSSTMVASRWNGETKVVLATLQSSRGIKIAQFWII